MCLQFSYIIYLNSVVEGGYLTSELVHWLPLVNQARLGILRHSLVTLVLVGYGAIAFSVYDFWG